MIAAEEAAKVQNDRAQRQEAAIQKWRAAPAETGNRGILPAWGRSAQRRSELGRHRVDAQARGWLCPPSG